MYMMMAWLLVVRVEMECVSFFWVKKQMQEIQDVMMGSYFFIEWWLFHPINSIAKYIAPVAKTKWKKP